MPSFQLLIPSTLSIPHPIEALPIRRLARFGLHHNPFIRHIVRRTRDYLETTLEPETNEPYLKPVRVKLYGETPQESIPLPLYLRDAYAIAEEFCELLGQRMKESGFLRTLLLRRVGSTICAGMNTAKSMLGAWEDIEEDDDEDAIPDDKPKSLTPSERQKLELFLDKLEANQEADPKYASAACWLKRVG